MPETGPFARSRCFILGKRIMPTVVMGVHLHRTSTS
jgi:hypothetical protein